MSGTKRWLHSRPAPRRTSPASSPSARAAADRATCTSSTVCSTVIARACRCSPSPRKFLRPRSAAGYFQETHPADRCSRNAAHYCELVSGAGPDAARARGRDPRGGWQRARRRWWCCPATSRCSEAADAPAGQDRRAAAACARSLCRRAHDDRPSRGAAEHRQPGHDPVRLGLPGCARRASGARRARSRRRSCTRCAARSTSSGTTPTTSA